MIFDLHSSVVSEGSSILGHVAIKPFNTNYTINTPDGEVVINGEHVTKIIAKKVFVYGAPEPKWTIDFFLSDGSNYTVGPSSWADDFAKNLGVG